MVSSCEHILSESSLRSFSTYGIEAYIYHILCGVFEITNTVFTFFLEKKYISIIFEFSHILYINFLLLK